MGSVSDGSDGAGGPRDSVSSALDLGVLRGRVLQVDGKAREWGGYTTVDGWAADLDVFTFSAAVAGSQTITFVYDSGDGATVLPEEPTDTAGGDTGTTDTASGDTGEVGEPEPELRWEVRLYDLTDGLEANGLPTTSLGGGYTDGLGGTLTIEAELEVGPEYAVVVIPLINDAEVAPEYTLTFSGHSPADFDIYAGAYLPFEEMMERGNPVGGSNVTDWSFDAENNSWHGSYRMTYIRQVDMVAPEGSEGDEEVQEVAVYTEGAQAVMIIAGDFANLNQGLPAGTFYSPEPVEVTLNGPNSGGEEICEEVPENTDDDPGLNLMHCRVIAPEIAITDIAPKVLGWEVAEVEPNDVVVDPYVVDVAAADLAAAQMVGDGTGVGFVDRVTGSVNFPSEAPGWIDGDSDAFSFRVTETLDASIALSWAGGADLDINLYGVSDETGESELLGYSWYSQPEIWNVSDYGAILEPGYTYTVIVLGWTGEVGDVDYTLEFEWLSP